MGACRQHQFPSGNTYILHIICRLHLIKSWRTFQWCFYSPWLLLLLHLFKSHSEPSASSSLGFHCSRTLFAFLFSAIGNSHIWLWNWLSDWPLWAQWQDELSSVWPYARFKIRLSPEQLSGQATSHVSMMSKIICARNKYTGREGGRKRSKTKMEEQLSYGNCLN